MKPARLEPYQLETLKDLPLNEYLDYALETNNAAYEWYEDQKYAEPYLSPIFTFTRLAKAHPDLTELGGDEALAVVEDNWLSTKGHDIDDAWPAFFYGVYSADDARTEFLDVWERIKLLPGESWLHVANRLAQREHFLEQLLPHCPTKVAAKFIALACALQRLRGTDFILLPCRQVAPILECTAQTVSRLRRWAQKPGVDILEVTTEHRFNPQKDEQDATEFRLRFDKVSELLKSAPNARTRKKRRKKAPAQIMPEWRPEQAVV